MAGTTTVAVDAFLKQNFHKLCKGTYGLTDREAVEILMKFVLEYNVNPEDLAALWRRNPKKDIAEYHNYTVGFLKTFEEKQNQERVNFEKKQLLLMNGLVNLLKKISSNNTIENAVQNEILFDIQMIASQINPQLGTKLTDRNNAKILKIEKEEGI